MISRLILTLCVLSGAATFPALKEKILSTGDKGFKTCQLAPNGMIYAPPGSGLNFIKYDPQTEDARWINNRAITTGGDTKFMTSTLLPDGTIFVPPGSHYSAYIIDTSSDDPILVGEKVSGNAFDQDCNSGICFMASTMAADGRVFAAPFEYERGVLVYDPSQPIANDARLKTIPVTLNGDMAKRGHFRSIVTSGTGTDLYAVPYKDKEVLHCSTIGDLCKYLSGFSGSSSSIGNYAAAVRATNGYIYAIPYGEEPVLRFGRSVNDPIETIGVMPTNREYRALGAVETDQKIYFLAGPASASTSEKLCVIDTTATSTVDIVKCKDTGISEKPTFSGITLMSDGRLVGIPAEDLDGLDNNYVLVIDPASLTFSHSRVAASGRELWSTFAVFGTDVVILPDGSPNVFTITAPATPTKYPTKYPTKFPTLGLTTSPTSSPATQGPTASPTLGPTTSPTSSPVTRGPTASPILGTASPATQGPTASPVTSSPVTQGPTASPITPSPVTQGPTASPILGTASPATQGPTASPGSASPNTASPATIGPSMQPTGAPTQTVISVDIDVPETVSVASLIYIHARLKAYAGVLIHRCDWNITHVKSTGSTTVRRPVSIKMKLKEMGLALLPGTLLPGSRYEFDLRVVYGSPGNSLTATAATVVRQTKTSLPVAVFAGGSKRTVSVSEGATIDASGSYDPARVKDSLKLFEWRCFRRATVSAGAWVTINCTGLLGSGVHSPLRVISPGAMSAGTQYRFKITFSVRTPSYGLFREGSAVTIIEAVSDPTPTCAIELAGAVTNAGTLFSPYGRKVKLLAAARPHPKSPTPKNMLRYGWTVAVTGSASGSAGLSLADSATDRPSFVLPWSSDIVPGATYAFKVTVTDPGFEFPVASTAVIDVRVGIAPNASVAVIPASGVAYDTVFQIQIAGAGESPLLYKFAYRQEPTSRVVYLEADSYDRVLNTTLPSADALTVLVGVRDALGSVAEATATVSVSEMARTAGSERVCSAARHAADSIRRILQETSAGGLGLCTLVELAVRSSVETGEYPRALRQISGIQTILDKMLRNVSQSGAGGNATDLTACTDPHANLGAPSGCATGGLGTLTPTTLTSALWDILFAELARVNEQDQALTGQVGLQSMGAAVELTSSPAANNSRQALESIANTTGRIIDSISTEDLTTGDAGKDAVQVISRIVQLAVENSNSSAATTVSGGGGSGAPGPSPGPSPGTGPGPSPSPRPGTSSTASEFCGALESAVGLTTTLMFRVGSSLIPGEAPLAYEGSVLGASATAVFADASAKLNVSGGAGSGANPATIELPPVLQIDGALKRPTALVATSAWKSLGSCRAGSVAAVDNGVVSVTVRANSSTAETHTFTDAGAMLLEFPSGAAGSDAGESVATVASCEFWSVAADDWSPEGCTTSITSEGGVACQCTHLTEFAVVRRQRRSASDGGAAVPVFAQRMYAAFTGVFALVCVGAAAQSVMIGRVRLGLFWRISICVMLAAACRVAGCVVLGQLNGQGEDPSSAVAYVISCGPYLFSYAVVLQHLLLLGTLLDRNAAGQKAEARAIAFRRATALATPALLLLVAGIFALGVFGGAAGLQGAYRAAATAVALMSFTFAAAFAHVYLRLRAVVKESQSHRSGGKVSVIGQYEAGTTPWRIAGGVAFAAQSVLMAASAYAVGADDETVYGMTGVYMAWDAALFVCTLALHRPSFMPKGATGSKRGGASSRGSRASTRSRGSVQSRVSLAEYGSRGRSSNSAGRGSKGLASQTPRSRRSAGPMTKRMQMLEQHRAAIAESQQRVSVQSMARFASDSQAVLAQSSSGIEMTGAEGKLALVGSRRSVAASSADDSAAWSPNSSRGEGRRPTRRAKIDQYLSPSGGVGPAFVQDARDSLSRNSVSQLSQKSRGGDDSILHIKSDENNMTQSWYSRSRMRVAI